MSLKKQKEELVYSSQLNIDTNNNKIKVHDIDYAIKLACTNYKSAITNYENGNIKHFRIRYWNKDKQIKVMDLQKNNFSCNSIRKNILGKVRGNYNGIEFNFNTIDKDCRLGYNSLTNEYLLYVPVDATCKSLPTKDLISLDP